MKTYSPKASEVKREWHVIDASGMTLGKLAVEVARLLRGKHKTMFSPHFDTGDFVIVINASRVHVTGKKREDKIYYRHSGYPGGLKRTTFGRLAEVHPIRPIEIAVKGMLPHNRLGRTVARRLKVYAGESHPHQSQIAAQSARSDNV
ncbi:MAG: 50S ribosomal protein L13 [Chloroflexota bacterium]|nr:50S ribosomal protein L13 [Chloroflexota bacterium]